MILESFFGKIKDSFNDFINKYTDWDNLYKLFEKYPNFYAQIDLTDYLNKKFIDFIWWDWFYYWAFHNISFLDNENYYSFSNTFDFLSWISINSLEISWFYYWNLYNWFISLSEKYDYSNFLTSSWFRLFDWKKLYKDKQNWLPEK